MCTVTWLRTSDGYSLFSNRDEKKTRRPARPPAMMVRNGVRYCAPIDGDHGGTWIAVNEFGLSLCLLNRYQDEPSNPTHPFTSRGEIVNSLISSRSNRDVLRRLNQKPLNEYRPFTLVGLTANATVMKVEWTGRNLVTDLHAEAVLPLVSSSFDLAGAQTRRREVYREFTAGGLTFDALVRFHWSHDPEPGPYAPCMHRSDAQTVSSTIVSVGSGGVTMRYTPGAPCQSQPGTTYTSFRLAEAA